MCTALRYAIAANFNYRKEPLTRKYMNSTCRKLFLTLDYLFHANIIHILLPRRLSFTVDSKILTVKILFHYLKTQQK